MAWGLEMARKRHKPEEIVAKLRQVEVPTAPREDGGRGGAGDRRDRSELRDELLGAEVFNTLREAQVLIERWRRHLYEVRSVKRYFGSLGSSSGGC